MSSSFHFDEKISFDGLPGLWLTDVFTWKLLEPVLRHLGQVETQIFSIILDMYSKIGFENFRVKMEGTSPRDCYNRILREK